MESLNSNFQERELYQLQQMQDKAKESCMISFRLLHSHLQVLSIKGGFERACVALFDQDTLTFRELLLLNLDHLEKQLDKEEFQETESIDAFRVLMKQFQTFINFRYCFDDFDGAMIRKSVNERVMQSKEGKVNSSKALDVDLVVTKSNETESERHVLSSRSGNDTHTDDADINSVNDKQPMAEVQLSAEHNILANEQQHSEQSESVYDTYLLEKVDRNTTPESTDMSHRGGEIDQNADAKKCQVSCPLPDPSFDNMTTEFSNQFLESENISLKKTVAQLQKDFSRMETHCVNMELKYQNQALKDGQHGQILNETINIELEYSVAKLLAENEIESVFAKPQHVIAPGSSRNSSKESYGSNDMAHNYYLEEAKKKTQDKNRNLKPRKMPSAKTHNTPNACTPKPRSNNQTSRNWPASKSCEETLKAMQKADHSRNPSSFSDFKHFAKIQPNKTRNSNKPVDPTSHTQKPGRKIVTGHSFSLNKSSVVHEKTNTPRSYLRWIPTGRIFNTAGLKWVPTGKTFTSSTTKVDCELPNGSNDYITNPYKCDQTLNVSADQHPCFMIMASVDNTSGPVPQRKERCTLQCALSSKEEKSSCILILERVNWVLRISGLYTLRLLDAACNKVLNLLKKGLLMSKMHSWTWDELVVSVQCLSSNPSLPLFLLHHLTIHGVRDFVCTMAEIGCNWAKIGPSNLHSYTIGLSRPIRWVKIAPKVCASVRHRLTSDSSVDSDLAVDGLWP
ncbi:hypothetical protein Tco_1017515 [Tanacetum coccineum]|uniref:Uncharacterized protein n=1 Tax=Tanacetum coccineum TaxID=301880 RepID=A0ABQ5FRR1_9ASTR